MKKIALVVALLAAVQTFPQSLPVNQRSLKKLASVISGEFDNNDQADADKSYYHVFLRIKPIWQDNHDGYWLYMEEAVTSSQHIPFRQRIYQIELFDDTTVVAKVYELKSPQSYIGAWKDDSIWGITTRDSIVPCPGCEIYLHRTGKAVYKGSTRGKKCMTRLRDASYATSDVYISRNKIIIWERGWIEHELQVWGDERGGYVFLKRK